MTVMPQYHELLGAVLQNVHSVAPLEWKIQLFISKENQTQVEELPLVRNLREQGRQVIITPTISYDMSYREYSVLFKTKDFWDQMQGKWLCDFEMSLPLLFLFPFPTPNSLLNQGLLASRTV